MIEVRIVNKIDKKVEEYINNYGSTKTFLAKKMGYKSRQAFDGALKSEGLSLETYIKFAYFFKCDIKELYEVKIYEDGKEILR